MKTNKAGLALIKSFEGLSLKPYKCPAGIITIGYGSTYYEDGTKVKMTDPNISEIRAELLLSNVLVNYEKIVSKKISIELTDNQFAALVSHTFNTGGSDTLFKLVNNKASKEEIKNWFTTKYITGGGKVLKGLVRRRQEEYKLFIL